MRRIEFLAGAAAGAALLSGCNSSSSTSPVPTGPAASPPPTVPAPTGGTAVADLRFGQAPTIPTAPGVDPAGDAKALILAGTPSPATSPIPGVQLTGSYAANERYVLRLPTAWNGKLVVAGTPSQRSEFANDAIWSDFLLANGYAYASSNKGIPYGAIVETLTTSPDLSSAFPLPYDNASLETKKYDYRLGFVHPNITPDVWNLDFARLVVAAKAWVQSQTGKAPTRTYAVGLSNGGAQVRSLLEQYPELVDGGVDWSGVFWSPNASLLDYMPKFLAAMPQYVSSGFTDAASAAAIVAAGYPADIKSGVAGHPSLWDEYYSNQLSYYHDLTVFAYGLAVDPNATSSVTVNGCTPNAANPTMLPGTCDATGLAVPANRAAYAPSAAARQNIARWQHTGAIGKPLVSIAGTADMFVTPANNATPYLNAVKQSGKGGIYWQYLVSGGTHVDTFANPAWGYGLQPQLAFAWAAFNSLVSIVEKGITPPGAGAQQTISTPTQIPS